MKTADSSPITNSVMTQIKNGKVKMHSRLYFALFLGASVTAILLSGLIVAYTFSVMFYWYRIQTAETMAWGARANLSTALTSFPWWAIPLALGMVITAVWLMRKQGTLYRHQARTIALLFVLISLLAGFGLSYLNLGKSHMPGMQGQRPNSSQTQRGQGLHR